MHSAAAILTNLRNAMQAQKLRALIVPTADSHNSEYVADCFKYREFICGFGGSAGTCVVTESQALLYTDGRYWLEASKSLFPGWELMKDGKVGVLPYDEWLAKELAASDRVGIDASTVTMSAWERMAKNINLVPTEGNLVRPLMHPGATTDGSLLPPNAIFPLDVRFAGKSSEDKVAEVCAKLRESSCDFTVLSALDDIAWLLNLRGADVAYNPVFYAYAAVHASGDVVLFTLDSKITPAVRAALPPAVRVADYDALAAHLAEATGKTCAVDEHQISQAINLALTRSGVTVKKVRGIVEYLKARKNAVELEGFARCHVHDGAALTRFIAWLKNAMSSPSSAGAIDEVDAADKLASLRASNEHFVQLSFGSISAVGPNGAIIHYNPRKETAAALRRDQLYLIDSGAQYLDGTTDVTRTLCFDAPRPEEREAYTLVLKGHIAINTCVFPAGVTGHRIDAFARAALWQCGLDYAHGTGHGVGFFLNVHEGPHGIGTRPSVKGAFLEQGMIVSNEPGFYKDGHFGIRIENLETIVPAATKYGDASTWSTFKQLTMAPLERELIDVDLLTPSERSWVDDYHRRVREALTPLLRDVGDVLALAYLDEATKPL